jgi:hypothetical protein
MPRYRVILLKDAEDILRGVVEVEAASEDAAEAAALELAANGKVEFEFKACGDTSEATVDSVEEISDEPIGVMDEMEEFLAAAVKAGVLELRDDDET